VGYQPCLFPHPQASGSDPVVAPEPSPSRSPATAPTIASRISVRRHGLAPANKADRAERDQYDQNNGRSTRLRTVPTSALGGRLRHRCPRPPKPAEQPREHKHDDHCRHDVPNTRVDPVHDLALRRLAVNPGMQFPIHTPTYTPEHGQQGLSSLRLRWKFRAWTRCSRPSAGTQLPSKRTRATSGYMQVGSGRP
jgi:hypothetical protein